MISRRCLRLVVAVASAAILTPACSRGSQRASFSGGVEAVGESPSLVTEPPTTRPTFTTESIVLSGDGLGALPFGQQAAQALAGLTEALGRAETWKVLPAGGECGATRVFTWQNFDVLVNEATATSGRARGLVGWKLGEGGTTPWTFKTAADIGIGSTVAALTAAYGSNMSLSSDEAGPVVTLTTPKGPITGRLDRLGDTGTIRSLRAGTACPG